MGLPQIFLALFFSLLCPTFSFRTLDPKVELPKCCPKGQAFKDASFSKCVATTYRYSWPAKEGNDGNIHFGVDDDDDDDEGTAFTFNAEPNLKYVESLVMYSKTSLQTSDNCMKFPVVALLYRHGLGPARTFNDAKQGTDVMWSH